MILDFAAYACLVAVWFLLIAPVLFGFFAEEYLSAVAIGAAVFLWAAVRAFGW